MARKLLVARLGAGSITIALCAALPGCNLAVPYTSGCEGQPGSRGQSVVVCPEGSGGTDGASDGAHDGSSEAASDATNDATDAPADHHGDAS